jgi:4'-phosphopantetheinyl transferase
MLVALSRKREVGVDLELIRRDIEVGKLADRFFCPAERAAMAQNVAEYEHEMFFRYWVAKEAVLKAQGVGISSLQDCEILLNGAGARTAIRTTPGSAVQPGWTVQFLSCESEWEGAVAAKGHDWIVRPQFAG